VSNLVKIKALSPSWVVSRKCPLSGYSVIVVVAVVVVFVVVALGVWLYSLHMTC
jgi:hypothetical protein